VREILKALVLEAYNRLVYTDIPAPVIAPDEVLIRVAAVGICGSDVHGLDGSTGRRIPPLVMGHEAAGVIEKTGEAVEGIAPGTRVTFDSTIYCGRCEFCRQGKVNLCENRRVFGVSCDEYRQDGAYAELVAVPARGVYPLADPVSFESAACVEPLSVAVHAANRAAGISQVNLAVVFGAGMIGQLILQVLVSRGCRRVVVSDPDHHRRELALALGAETALDPEKVDVAAKILELTAGAGAGLAFDAVGIDQTVTAGIGCLAKGGKLVLVGNFRPTVNLMLQRTVVREIEVYGSCASAGEYPECLDLLARGAVRVEPLISAVAPLAEGPAWFDRLYRGEPGLLKVILKP